MTVSIVAQSTAMKTALQIDIRYLRALGSGLPSLLALMLTAGLIVALLCSLFPSAHHRPLRLVVGGLVLLILAELGRHLFNPNECFTGAVCAATLIAFNTPLRAIQFLATPPKRTTTTNEVNPIVLILVLVAVPASALLIPNQHTTRPRSGSSKRNAAHSIANGSATVRPERTSRLPPAVSPTRGMASAIISFIAASTLTYVAPISALRSSIVLIPMMTMMTHGFVVLTTSMAGLLSGVPVSAPFCWPWWSPSLSSFWAYRWNAPIANALRSGVFDPLRVYGRFGRTACTMTSFFVSGVAHAVILFYGTENGGAFKWLLFFVLHGIGVCMERAALELPLVSKMAGSWPVRRLYFVAFMLVTAELLFFSAMRDSALFETAMRELGTGPRMTLYLFRLFSQ